MAKQHSPDGRLVYLHCSSIFSGANAQVRKAKKVSQLLNKHKASIKILTNEFTLPAVAAVAKELLEKQIFESLPGQSSVTRSCSNLRRRKKLKERPQRQKSSRPRPRQRKT